MAVILEFWQRQPRKMSWYSVKCPLVVPVYWAWQQRWEAEAESGALYRFRLSRAAAMTDYQSNLTDYKSKLIDSVSALFLGSKLCDKHDKWMILGSFHIRKTWLKLINYRVETAVQQCVRHTSCDVLEWISIRHGLCDFVPMTPVCTISCGPLPVDCNNWNKFHIEAFAIFN